MMRKWGQAAVLDEIKLDRPVLARHWIAGEELNSTLIGKRTQRKFRRIYVQI